MAVELTVPGAFLAVVRQVLHARGSAKFDSKVQLRRFGILCFDRVVKAVERFQERIATEPLTHQRVDDVPPRELVVENLAE